MTLTVLGAITHTWSDLNNSNTNVVSLVGDSVFSVFGIDGFGCLNSQSYTQKISPCTGISALEDEKSTFFIYPSPTKDVLNFSNVNTTNVGILKIYNTIGEVILDIIPNANNNSVNLNLPAGVYYFAYFENERIVKKGPLIIRE